MKKAIIYQKEECVIIRTVNLSNKVFAFFVAVNSKKIIYLKENIYNDNTTYASLDKMIQSLKEYQIPAIFNSKILLDTFVNTVNYKIKHGYITDSDEIIEMIIQFEKIIKDPYIVKMTSDEQKQIFNMEAMYQVTNTIKKIDGKVRKVSIANLINNLEDESNDVFVSHNWLEAEGIDNKELVYSSIMKSNKEHKKSPIDFLFNNKVLNIYMVIMIVAAVTFASCLQMINTWKTSGENTAKTAEDIKKQVLIVDPDSDSNNNGDINDPNAIDPTKKSNTNSNSNTSSNTTKTSKYGKVYTEYSNMSVLQVNFNKLKQINPDTVAWIYINNTGDSKSDNINYPVVQSSDNSYYLTHDFNKKKNVAGWIYGDYRTDFTSFKKKNTIIYGHGRTDGVMFGNLEKVLNKSWYTNKDNHYIKLSTPTKDTLWRIVSIYVIKSEGTPLKVNFENDTAYKNWIDTIMSKSIYNFGYKPTVNNKFLTLQTCKDFKGNRIYVHSVLVTQQSK